MGQVGSSDAESGIDGDRHGALGFRSALARFPRLELAHFPTPLVEAPRLTRALHGPRVLIKREDLAGVGMGGSKFRILEFTLAAAVAKNTDLVIAGGHVQSNHPQQAAVAAARLGLPIIILLGDAEGSFVWQGNPFLEHLCGVEVRLVPGADLDGVRRQQELLAVEVRARGRRPAIITLTREVYVLSVLAYASFTFELMDQLRDLGIAVDAVYVGSGGATYAGMLLGSLALRRPFRVVGFTPTGSSANQRKYVADLLQEAIRWLGQDLTIPQDAIEVFDDYVGEALNVPASDAVQAIRLVASTEGMFLDPVYSSRAMAGLAKHAQCHWLDDRTVVFVHTGGLPSLFAFAASLSPAQ